MIAKANGIEHIKAHDALSDVYATIEVARIIKDKAPDYWNECMKILGPRDLMEYIKIMIIFMLHQNMQLQM